MPSLSENDKILIRGLRVYRGYSCFRLLQKFPEKWPKSTVHRLLARIDQNESIKHKGGSGRPRTARNPDTVAVVEERVLSQENAPGTHMSTSTREISKETGVSQTSVRRIIHKDLHLKCLRRMQAQE